jgi:TonB family protein
MKVSSVLLLPCLLVVSLCCVQAGNAQSEEVQGSRKVVGKVTPAYPDIARKLNLTGSVKLEVTVLPGGSVKTTHVLGGNPLLAQSAENAIRNWKWEKSEHETTEVVQVQFNP